MRMCGARAKPWAGGGAEKQGRGRGPWGARGECLGMRVVDEADGAADGGVVRGREVAERVAVELDLLQEGLVEEEPAVGAGEVDRHEEVIVAEVRQVWVVEGDAVAHVLPPPPPPPQPSPAQDPPRPATPPSHPGPRP